MARKKTEYDIQQEKRRALGKEFDAKLRAVEDSIEQLANAVLVNGKYHPCARERTGEFLSDARRSVRAVLNHEDWQRRR